MTISINRTKLRTLAALTAGALTSVAMLSAGTGTAAAATGTQIVNIANANLGKHYCDTNSAGGTGFANSCTANGGTGEFWCGDFVSWVWQQAGVPVPASNPASVPSWMSTSAYHPLSSGYTPKPGDAVIFGDDTYPTQGSHIAIVTNYSNGLLSDVGGDENGGGSPWWSTSQVQADEGNGAAWNPATKLFAGQSYEMWVLGYVDSGAGAIPAGFNVSLWGFNSGQTVSGTLNLTAHPTQSGVINWLDYVITGPNGYHNEVRAGGGANNYPYTFDTTGLTNGTYTISMIANEIDGQNHTYQGGTFTASNNAVFAKNSIGLYNWTKESDPLVAAQATGGGVQMILDTNGVVWAKNSIGLYNWTKESDPGVKAIAVGSDGTQMILDSTGRVLAKNSIGLYNWTLESDPGVKAISTNGGVQMILDSTGAVLAKNSIGLYNWTQESDPRVQAIAMGADGTQMILDNNGTVYAKNSIGLYNWTQESDPVDKAIAIGSDGTQMILDNNGTVWAKQGIGLYNWTQESDPRVQAISTNAGIQMILDNNGTVYAKNSIGLYNWTQETDAVVKAIAVGSDGTQMILGQ